jgi:hypothetical protein
VPLDVNVTIEDLREFATVPIGTDSAHYRSELERSSLTLKALIDAETRVVLLGSIASGKYVDTLLEIFGERLRFPEEFVGRGDMSRGSLMLRCAESSLELTYVPIDGRSRHGKRPPRLEPRRWPRPV